MCARMYARVQVAHFSSEDATLGADKVARKIATCDGAPNGAAHYTQARVAIQYYTHREIRKMRSTEKA